MNEASPRLEEIRQSKQENLAQLRKRADEWARAMYAAGAAERPQVVIRRDRLCIPIKAGRQSDLPRGSLALATSGSGGTVYMEPEPLISLNNNDATLTAAEQEEEERILTLLSKSIADHSNQISTILSAIATLDLAFARARHAAWMGSESPRLVSIKDESSLHSLMHVEAAVHPLLAQRSRPPLPVPLLPEAGLPAGQHQIENMVGIELIPELMRDSDPLQINPLNPTQVSTRASNRPRLNRRGGKKASIDQTVSCNESIQSAAAAPTPIDLTVPPSVSVVAVTGPNTGGKTASLKTLGLIVLMVKAGLFVPTSTKSGDNRPVVAWFDKVLADIGDGQSLQQSLSTFSSHIKRIRELMLEASPSSLLLLDELGSGTNPLEGAALACALLEYFSKSRTALTYATSHHAEVKEMADRLPNFVNASVEFNYSTLKPTFKLIWGSAGESNALRVAQGLGFDPKIIKEAHDVADQLRTGSLSTSNWATNLQASLQQQLEEALVSIVDSAKRKEEAERYRMKAVEELKAVESQLGLLSSKKLQAERTTCLETARSKVKKIVRALYNDNKSIKEAEADIRRIEKELLLTADKTAELGMSLEKRGTSSLEDQSWAPAVGDWVSISKMRGTVGQITKLHGNEKVTVRAGALTIQLQWGEYSLADKPTKTSSNSTKYRSSSFSALASAKGRKYKDIEGAGGESRQERSARGGVAVQTTRNTIDVRGFTAASAEAEVDAALKSAERGAVLFMVHGIGTGKVREAVLQCLKQNRNVERWEEEEGSKGGCTVVYMRQSE
jgi:DNA mismatch repair protein MutS2